MKQGNKNVDQLTDELNELKLKIAKMNARRNAQISFLKDNMDKGSLWNGFHAKSQYLYPNLYYDEPRYRYSYLYPKYRSLDNLLSYKYYEKPSRKAVAFTAESDENNLKSRAQSNSMSDLLAKLKDFVFEQEKQLTDDLMNRISRSRQSGSPLRSAISYNNLTDPVDSSVSSDLFLNPVNRRDNFYKRYNAYAKRIFKPLPSSSIRSNTYTPWWLNSDYKSDLRWARWYNRYLYPSRYRRYLPDYDYYYYPKIHPISLPSDVKSIVKDKTKFISTDDDKPYSPEIRPSYDKYDPFESDTYIRSRLPSWKQYYYTQKLRSKPSNESSLRYYDPYYDFFPDSASVDSTDELNEKNIPVGDELPSDTKQLIDDYRDAIYENIIQNLRTKQQRWSNTFPRRKSDRLRRSLSSTLSPDRSYVQQVLDKDKFYGADYDYGSSSFQGKKYSEPPSDKTSNLANHYLNMTGGEPSRESVYKAKNETYTTSPECLNLKNREYCRGSAMTSERPDFENVLPRNYQSFLEREKLPDSKVDTRLISQPNDVPNKNTGTVTFAPSDHSSGRDSLVNAQSHTQRKPSIDNDSQFLNHGLYTREYQRDTTTEKPPIVNTYPKVSQNSLPSRISIIPGEKLPETSTTDTVPLDSSGYSSYLNKKNNSKVAQTYSRPQFNIDKDNRSIGFTYEEPGRNDEIGVDTYVDNIPQISRDIDSLYQSSPVQDNASSYRQGYSIIPRDETMRTSNNPAPQREDGAKFVNQLPLGSAHDGRYQNNKDRVPQDNRKLYNTYSTERPPISNLRSNSIVAQEKPNQNRSTPLSASPVSSNRASNRPPLTRRGSVKMPPSVIQRKPSIDQIIKTERIPSVESNSLPLVNGTTSNTYDQTAFIPESRNIAGPVRKPNSSTQSNKVSSNSTESSGGENSQITLPDADKPSDPDRTLERRNSKAILPPEAEQQSSSSLDLDQGSVPRFQRRDSKMLLVSNREPISEAPLDSDRETHGSSNRPSFAGSTSFDTDRKFSSDQEPLGEYPYQSTGYAYDAVDPSESYRGTDFSQPIYEQYEGNVDYYYDNNNYQPSRYETDQGYIESNGRAVETISAPNYEENIGNPVYESYDQPYYGNEFDPNVTPSDAYYPQAQNYESYQNANYATNENPENYVDYDTYNSTFANGTDNYYAPNELLPDRPLEENEGIAGKSTTATSEMLQHIPASLSEDQDSGQPSAQPVPIVDVERTENEEDTKKVSRISETAPSGNRKTSVENGAKVREPISRRASKVTLQSSSEDRRLKTQPLNSDSQKRVPKTKLGENKLKRTPSTVNRTKTPLSKRT